MAHSWKGAEGELEVAKSLQAWWRQLEPDAVFVRTPRSGGWASSHTAGFKARGDVMVDRELCRQFPFSVEVKWRRQAMHVGSGRKRRYRRGAWSLEKFLAGDPRSPVLGWWRQCVEAATKDGLRPILWFRGNNMGWLVMLEAAMLRRLRMPPSLVPGLVVDGVEVYVLEAPQLLLVSPAVIVGRACALVERPA